MNFPNPHAAIDGANFAADRRVAAALRTSPELIDVARQNLERWADRWGELSPPHREWAQIIRMLTLEQLAGFLESTTPKANRLRQSSPFSGVLKADRQSSSQERDAA